MGQVLFVDANVLYSRTLRDWLFLLRFADPDRLTVFTSEDVLAETVYRYRRNHPDAPGRLIAAIRSTIVNSLSDIVTDYQIDGSFLGGDIDDRHVHAAALACGADVLLTDDQGFVGHRHGYDVVRPDPFFVAVDDSDPALVSRVTAQQVDYWTSRRGTSRLPEALEAAGCPQFAERVQQHQHALGPWQPSETDPDEAGVDEAGDRAGHPSPHKFL